MLKLIAFTLLISVNTACSQNVIPAMKTIEVTGSYEIEIDPDEIIFDITIQEYWKEEFEGKKYEDFKTKIDITDIERDLVAGLTEIGIKMSQVTLNQSGNYWRPYGKDYQVSKSISVKIKSFEEANNISNKLRVRGIQNMMVSQLKNKDIEQHKLKVKTEALKAAKNKAEILASGLGLGIGEVITIVEIDQNVGVIQRPQAYNRGAMMAEAKAAPDVSYENFRKINLSAEMRVVFSLK